MRVVIGEVAPSTFDIRHGAERRGLGLDKGESGGVLRVLRLAPGRLSCSAGDGTDGRRSPCRRQRRVPGTPRRRRWTSKVASCIPRASGEIISEVKGSKLLSSSKDHVRISRDWTDDDAEGGEGSGSCNALHGWPRAGSSLRAGSGLPAVGRSAAAAVFTPIEACAPASTPGGHSPQSTVHSAHSPLGAPRCPGLERAGASAAARDAAERSGRAEGTARRRRRGERRRRRHSLRDAGCWYIVS